MSLTLKLGSLVIRTLSKPIANYIKKNAREHERFRKLCVGFAQRLHRIDMRMRLGLLQDPAAIDRQIAREVAEAEAKRKKLQVPTVPTEAQAKADGEALAKERDKVEKKVKSEHRPPRIRPLSESKAIETGANFISETFLFFVAGGLILYENRRSRRKSEKAHDKRDDEIESIRAENTTIRAEVDHLKRDLALLQGGKTENSTQENEGNDPHTPPASTSSRKDSLVKDAPAASAETAPSTTKSMLPNWLNR